MKKNSPESSEKDSAGHVERPTAEVVFAHFGLAHGVEEELQVPKHASGGSEGIVEGEAPRGEARG